MKLCFCIDEHDNTVNFNNRLENTEVFEDLEKSLQGKILNVKKEMSHLFIPVGLFLKIFENLSEVGEDEWMFAEKVDERLIADSDEIIIYEYGNGHSQTEKLLSAFLCVECFQIQDKNHSNIVKKRYERS